MVGEGARPAVRSPRRAKRSQAAVDKASTGPVTAAADAAMFGQQLVPQASGHMDQLLLLNMQLYIQRQVEHLGVAAGAAPLLYPSMPPVSPSPMLAPRVAPVPYPPPTYSPSGGALFGAFRAVFINLDERVDRRVQVELNLRAVGMSALRFQALRGQDVAETLVTRTWDSTVNSQFDVKTLPAILKMSPGERGCAASHAHLWQQVASLPLDSPPLLVLEDDVCFCPGIVQECASRIAVVEAVLPPEQRRLLLYPGAEVVAWRAPEAAVWPDAIRWREAHYLWQTSSYLLWPAAARVLVSHMPIDAPVDVFIAQHVMTRRLTALVAQPPLAWQAAPYKNGDIRHSNVYKNGVVGATATNAQQQTPAVSTTPAAQTA